ncbi:MAG: Tad domain-containing protein [Sphingomonadaceae bacterium]|nr:Tad domain-containing protein [Sphingomonadaceae bacterium]
MTAKTDAEKRAGFLARLRKDQSGNVIAIMAAAVFPAIGIIGGGVDMSRIYLTRTTLQAACDAGALMGRRTMGTSTWDSDGGRANTRALQIFDTNFENGAYDSRDLSRSFSESGGTVTGRASVEVPMAMMSVFGIKEKEISVTCTAEMRIPASDIMFVLDTTGSMNCPDDGSSCNGYSNTEAPNAKIKGLRTAASCFYEALAKQNVPTVSPEDCDEEEEPVGATSDVRLRFGFVPYAVNVNVGRLLPLEYMADRWTYQSREAVWEDRSMASAYDPSYGTEGPLVQTATSTTNNSNTSWTNVNVNLNHPVNGQTYSYNYQRANSSTACVSGIPSVPGTTTGNLIANGQSPTTPTYPQTTVTKFYYRTNTGQVVEYQYSPTQSGNGNNRRYFCQLQTRTTGRTSTRIDYSATVPVTWVYNPSFLYWHYKPTTFDVSGLKDETNNGWNNTVTLPINTSGTNRTITWNGCIEERQTQRVTDNDPSDNWDPIPANALDMDIEMAPDPDTAATMWGPMLGSAIYTRYITNSSTPTMTTFQTSSNSTSTWFNIGGQSYRPYTISENCPTQAQLYREMDAAAFSAYMTNLRTGGNTYHDSGLLWGARLMAPNGIFSDITSDTDTWVERHMVFMTDGDTVASNINYSMHGVHWWDRRQNNGTSAPSNDWLESNINARTQAICDWVKNENITLWVVAFGAGITDETKENLENCATEGRYFEADDTAGLVAKFKQIANQISALRLTQ